jgi:HupE / UreJ protein
VLLRLGFAIGLAGLALATLQAPVTAHEIPNEVTVQTFLKPEGRRAMLLVRVPLKAMRDMDVPRRPGGFVDLARIDPVLRDAATLWIGDYVHLYENDQLLAKPQVLAARVSLPSDRSFQQSYDEALAHVTGPGLPHDTELYWEQGLLDVAFAYAIESDRSEFAISPGLTRLGLRVNVVLRFLLPGGPERVFDLHGDTGAVKLDPRWYQAALRFVREGFFHILDGIDHLLFLFCLVIPFRRFLALAAIVTSFTVAHSITLIASALGVAPGALWFPALVETLIAMSIVYMALENIASPTLQRRWLITFAFGLVHGFGFSFALRETLQLAGSHVLTALLAFNVGVELGQLVVLVVLIPALDLLFRYGVRERIGTIILSALVAHTGWHWMIERGDALRQYRFEWPVFDMLLLASLMRWLMLLIIIGGALWLLRSMVRRPVERESESL